VAIYDTIDSRTEQPRDDARQIYC